jgi:ubiquinone/menaquinone biosynthesis C-methylase UbiE
MADTKHVNGVTSEDKVMNGAEAKLIDPVAYAANLITHSKGINHEAMVDAYSKWANRYDLDLRPGVYNGPEIAARYLAEAYSDKLKTVVRVLDVAAGTGRVGDELKKRGFCDIDALEPSGKMLDIAREKKTYTNTIEDSIGYKTLNIPAGSYDCLVIAGGMGENHIPVKGLDEMIRLTKSSGLVVIVMREEYLVTVEQYKDRLEPYMKQLEDENKWHRVLRDVVPRYSFNKNGIVYIYRVV